MLDAGFVKFILYPVNHEDLRHSCGIKVSPVCGSVLGRSSVVAAVIVFFTVVLIAFLRCRQCKWFLMLLPGTFNCD